MGVQVVEVTADNITFDSNHPLAGEDLTFEVTLLEILA
jgi:peptidylprolyl isomerase